MLVLATLLGECADALMNPLVTVDLGLLWGGGNDLIDSALQIYRLLSVNEVIHEIHVRNNVKNNGFKETGEHT